MRDTLNTTLLLVLCIYLFTEYLFFFFLILLSLSLFFLINRMSWTSILSSPVSGLPDVMDNRVVTVRFRDLKYDLDFVFPARRLEGAVDPPRVLKPQDFDDSKGNYRPVIGFNRNMPRASMSQAGHRMIG